VIGYTVGVFLILHGFVHLLYCGQSARIFELQPGMVWPDGSWVFSRLLGDTSSRVVATVFLILAALGLIAAGLALLFGHGWWRPVAIASLTMSSLLFLALWNGRIEQLANQGAVGLAIDVAILIALLGFQWPRFAF